MQRTAVVAAAAAAWWWGTSAGAAAGPEARDALCRTFAVGVEKELLIDTSDGTSEVGRWVAERRAQGWGDARVDIEVVSRSSGTLAGFATVCVSR